MTKWRSGPPPSVGWWPASKFRSTRIFRWWDGSTWSVGVFDHENKQLAAQMACLKDSQQSFIKWTDRPAHWPERSLT